MNKQNLASTAKKLWVSVSKRKPEILTGIGIAGMISTTFIAVSATPEALRLLHEAERVKGDVLTPIEKVKVAWKPYIPAAITGIASTTCLIGASSINAQRTAALAAAYQLSETALTEYREKVVETIGEKKERVVREKVNQKQIDKNPIQQEQVYITGKGNTLFLDPLSRRYFRSDLEKIRKAENVLNKQIIHDIGGFVSLNDFYDEIGLPHIDLGDTLGWNSDNLIDIDPTPGLSENEEPCIVVGHYNAPRYERY